MKKLATLLAVGGALMVAAPASAQQSVEDGYGGRGAVDQQVLGEVGTVDAPQQQSAPSASEVPAAQPTPAAQQAEGTLPFTGLDVALIALGGVLLVGLGLTVRRLSRDPGAVA